MIIVQGKVSQLGRLALFLLASSATFAHDRYILPSHTVLSGDSPQSVSLLASISNDMFHPDRALGDNGKGTVDPRLKGLFDALQAQVILPDGSLSKQLSWQAFSRFSAADLKITASGTYRICLAQPESFLTSFQNPDGSYGRRYGKTPKLPEGASQIVKWTTSSRVETFVTLNQTSKPAVQPIGSGLELGGKSHPNDLFVGEKASFQLLLNGAALTQSASVKVVRGGTRHRNQRELLSIETNPQGWFELPFKKAGFYLMHAEVTFPGLPGTQIDKRHFSLYVTLEVFPT